MILDNKYKESIINIFRENLLTESEVLAYGSRVRGDAHEASDLDIIIKAKFDKAIPKYEMKLIIEKFKESNIPIIIDLRDWAIVPEYFQKYIEEMNVLIYKNF